MPIVVEGDVPLPSNFTPGHGRKGETRIALEGLEPGQSFVVYGERDKKTLHNNIKEMRRYFPDRTYTTRQDKEPGFTRVWRAI